MIGLVAYVWGYQAKAGPLEHDVFGMAVLGALAVAPLGFILAAAYAVVWLLVVARASIPRPEGDLLLVGGGTLGVITMVFLGLGLAAAAAAVGRVLSAAARERRSVPAAPAVREPSGSGSGGAR